MNKLHVVGRALSWIFAFAAMTLATQAAPSQTVPTKLAQQGQAQFKVVIGIKASEESRVAADELADYLGRISGAEFEVEQGDGLVGLAVGSYDEFPQLALDDLFNPEEKLRREEYLLRSHGRGIHLIGATPAASRLAVWDLLYRLGYRQFFPSDHWEVIPSERNLSIAVDVIDKPDYNQRFMSTAGSRWAYAEPFLDQWRIRNRNVSGESFELRTMHVYETIIRSNRAAFDANPEYYPLINGERRYRGANTKFCVSNEGLQKLVVDHAIRRIESNPELDSLSMDPSDGGGWCECEPCAELGTVSDRVVILANAVAEAINELEYGEKFVGMYAYAHHSTPPTKVRIHPNVIVSVATAFIRDGYSPQQLVEEWSAKGATMGVREYYSIPIWHGDRPGEARAASMPYLSRTIKHFHEQGVRFNIARVSHSWGPYGLGFYMMAQMLWDVDMTDQVDELYNDFLYRAFGPAREPMDKFHRLLYQFHPDDNKPMMSEHLLGQMYGHLYQARVLAGQAGSDENLIARINDMILYTRFVELLSQTESEGGDKRQALGEELIRHRHAMRSSMLVSYYRVDSRQLPSFKIPTGDALDAVQSVDAYTSDDIVRMLREGIENNELLDFEPVTFSQDLIPAADALEFPILEKKSIGQFAPRRRQVFYTWLEKPGDIHLNVQGGMMEQYRNRGNVRLILHSPLDELGEGIARDESVPPDGEEHRVTMTTPFSGLHWIVALDGDDSTWVRLEDEALPYTVPAKRGESFSLRGRWDLYFYVPRGTKVIGGFARRTTGQVLDSNGDVALKFSSLGKPSHFSIPVPPGQDGKLWSIEDGLSHVYLMTVPPYMAASPQDLLLPREVVDKDRR